MDSRIFDDWDHVNGMFTKVSQAFPSIRIMKIVDCSKNWLILDQNWD